MSSKVFGMPRATVDSETARKLEDLRARQSREDVEWHLGPEVTAIEQQTRNAMKSRLRKDDGEGG